MENKIREMDLSNRRLILVSNAEPYAHRWKEGEKIAQEKMAGGLTSALDPLMSKVGGVWIAWGREDADFEVLDSQGKIRVPDENGYELKRLNLTEDEVEKFYLGFSNEILWPICHSFLEKASLSDYSLCEEEWEIYQKVNRKYSEAVLKELEEGDLVWIHDYHLTLVPEMIRNEYPETNIALFWHIPWPPWEMFRCLPWKKEIMNGLLGSDFIGFHTSKIKNNFFLCAEMLGKAIKWKRSTVQNGDRCIKVSSVPLGIDYDLHSSLKEKEEVKNKVQYLKDEIPEKIILGVDRLDYTKGIPQRLRAFELFLDENPEFQGKVTLVQRIPPSRGSVKGYEAILDRIHRIEGQINGKLSKANWTPIISFHRFLPRLEQLVPYYIVADVALVTPLIDGMNLVSKEYIANVDDGVLILSEFTGAAEELKEAIIVNPFDAGEVGGAIKKALTMPEGERKYRLRKLKERVKEKDLNWWRKEFLKRWLKGCQKMNKNEGH